MKNDYVRWFNLVGDSINFLPESERQLVEQLLQDAWEAGYHSGSLDKDNLHEF